MHKASKSTPRNSQIAGEGRLQLTRALRQLREQAGEMGDYKPGSVTLQLKDGSWLELRLKPSSDGGKLLGVWEIVRRWNDGRRTIYPV